MPIRILICDDHRLIQRGIQTLLQDEAEFEIVGAASDADEAIDLTRALRPDLVLMDVSMPGGDGIGLTRQLKQILPELNILVLTVHEDEGMLQEALMAGASGYIVKRAAESELIDAVYAVMRGDIYIHPTMTRSLLSRFSTTLRASSITAETLTAREVEVLRLLARGYTNRQIADLLVLSVRTVEAHRANITAKLSLRSRVDLADYAERNHLLE